MPSDAFFTASKLTLEIRLLLFVCYSIGRTRVTGSLMRTMAVNFLIKQVIEPCVRSKRECFANKISVLIKSTIRWQSCIGTGNSRCNLVRALPAGNCAFKLPFLPLLQLKEVIVITHQLLIGRQTESDTRDQSIYLHFLLAFS